LKDLHRLAIADLRGKGVDVARELAGLQKLQERTNQVLAAGAVLSPKDLVLRGGDMMKVLAIPPGPIVGEILQSLVEIAIEEPAENTRERLLEHARKLLAERRSSA
jgi:tRNA nucleotidyltransferase (CCA-adding enzyme)